MKPKASPPVAHAIPAEVSNVSLDTQLLRPHTSPVRRAAWLPNMPSTVSGSRFLFWKITSAAEELVIDSHRYPKHRTGLSAVHPQGLLSTPSAPRSTQESASAEDRA
jgi:hypothetical protein